MTRHVASASLPDVDDLGEHYARSRGRLRDLLYGADPSRSKAPVDACPGWNVHDVVAHLVGVIEDAASGQIRGIPGPDQTQAQVERHANTDLDDLLDRWSALAPPFELRLSSRRSWPAVLDALCHEHDIRTAIQCPGERAIDSVRLGAHRLLSNLSHRADLTVHFDGEVSPAPTELGGQENEGYHLSTSHFEHLRLRLGRRSVAQVTGLAWSRDPTPILGDLFAFGPSPVPIDEPAQPPQDTHGDRPCSS